MTAALALVLTALTPAGVAAVEEAAPGPAIEVPAADGARERCAVPAAEARAVPRRCQPARSVLVFGSGGRTIGAHVPSPGERVTATHVYPDGSTGSLSIDTDPEGATEYAAEVVEEAPLEAGSGGTSGGPSACQDGAYRLPRVNRGGVERQMRWFSTMRWYVRRSSVPAGVGTGDAIAAVRRGAINVTTGRNGCGLSPRISASASYQGGTGRSVDLSPDDRTCAARPDGVSVVSFGNIESSGPLAATCTFARYNGTPRHRITEADVRLDASARSWWFPPLGRCPSFAHYSLQAVAVHEFGHAFGLGHVSESGHGNLSMSSRIQVCDDSATTLGRGDVRGLAALY